MNKPPESFIRVKEEQLMVFGEACFTQAGLEEEHAALFTRLLVNSDLRGVRSHGSRNINGYCSSFERRNANPQPKIQVLQETPATAVLDGDGTLGYLPMVKATEIAIAKAKAVGLGMATVRPIGHYGSAGHYTRICMESGCIGFSVQGYIGQGDARGAEERPQIGYYGNPPISFAIPSNEEPPVVLDAASCIMADYQRGPEFDAMLSQIPAAFFKSMGYTAIASLLGGGLTGFNLPELESVRERWPAAQMGGMVLAIHIGSVVDEDIFAAEVDRMVSDVRETYEPMPGYDRALLPGGIEVEKMAQYRNDGIPYGEAEQESARQVSERLAVPLPWV